MTELFAIAPQRPIALRLWDRALDLIFPPRCVSCDRFGAFICENCLADATQAAPPRCSICWMPNREKAGGPATPGLTCTRCRSVRPSFRAARSVFVYQGAARDAVHSLQFRGLPAIAPAMSALMAQRLVEWSPPVDCIIPVPLARARRRERGYNQSELLAKELSRRTAIPLERRALVRPHST